MKAIMSEVKNTLDGINSRLDIAEEKTGEFEDITIETIKNETETHREKRIKKIKSISELWANFKMMCVCVCKYIWSL